MATAGYGPKSLLTAESDPSPAREIVRQLEHGDEAHRQWLRDKAIPLIDAALQRERDALPCSECSDNFADSDDETCPIRGTRCVVAIWRARRRWEREARATAERERDEIRAAWKLSESDTWEAIALRAEARIERLDAALRKYGRHDALCSVVGGYAYPCTCGFDAALTTAGPQP